MIMPNALSSVAGASCTSSSYEGDEYGAECEGESSEHSVEEKQYETIYVANG